MDSIHGRSHAVQQYKYKNFIFINPGSIPESGRFSGEGNGNGLQYSCLENSTDRGFFGVTKSQTRLSDYTSLSLSYIYIYEMATHSIVLAWRIPGMGSLVGCRLWGHTESDTTEAT